MLFAMTFSKQFVMWWNTLHVMKFLNLRVFKELEKQGKDLNAWRVILFSLSTAFIELSLCNSENKLSDSLFINLCVSPFNPIIQS
jgi:hypothetical protein